MNFNRLFPYIIMLGVALQYIKSDPVMVLVVVVLWGLMIKIASFVGETIWLSNLIIPYKLVSMIVFALALGITVYNTTQYVARYRLEQRMQTVVPEIPLKS